MTIRPRAFSAASIPVSSTTVCGAKATNSANGSNRWDGEPARGRGGTAQIIAEAVLLGVPVIRRGRQNRCSCEAASASTA